MADLKLKTVGPLVVLVGLASTALVQATNGGESVAAEVAAPEATTSVPVAPTTTQIAAETTTTTTVPFTYRLGVLASATTDSFWEYYGSEPTVWNSYMLGPTKPALFRVDDDSGDLVPELLAGASDVSRVGDRWQLTVEVSAAYSWSDGEPITADDVEFTFDTVREAKLGGSWADSYHPTISDVVAETPQRLRVVFSEKPDVRVWPYGLGLAPVMPRHVWEDRVSGRDERGVYSLPGDADVGGGQLSLTSVADNLVVSERNQGYAEPIGPARVEYHVFPDEEALLAALNDGRIDATLTPKGLAHSEIANAAEEVATITSPASAIRYLGFNLRRAPMSDKAFRSALALLLDKETLADEIEGSGEPAWTLSGPGNGPWFDADSHAAIVEAHTGELAELVDDALSGLAAAGYAWTTEPFIEEDGAMVSGTGLTIDGGTPPSLTILTPGDSYDPARPEYVDRIVDILGFLGFSVEAVETDFDTVVNLAFTPGEDGEYGFDMYVLGWTLGGSTYPGYYRAFFADDGELNNTGYSSQAFTSALAAFERAESVAAASEAVWEMEALLADDMPYLLLYTSEITEAYRKDRVAFPDGIGVGGLQARLGGIGDVAALPSR